MSTRGGGALTDERARIVRFLATGGTSAALNLVTRAALGRVVAYEVSIVLAYAVGIVAAYALARRFVFTGTGRAIGGEFARFACVNGIGFAQVWVSSVALAHVLAAVTGSVPWAETVAHAMALCSLAGTSYVLHSRFSFGPRRGGVRTAASGRDGD